MDIKLILKSLFSSAVVLLVSAGVGIYLGILTYGLGFPLAIYILPFLYFLFRLLKISYVKDKATRKSLAHGVLIGTLLWVGVCVYFITAPTSMRVFFRFTFPGLTQFDLFRDGHRIANAVDGIYQGSNTREKLIFLEMKGWTNVTAEHNTSMVVELESLTISGLTNDKLSSYDSLSVIKRVRDHTKIFLNDKGHGLLAKGKWFQRESWEHDKQTGLPRWIEVFVTDSSNTAINAQVWLGSYLKFDIQKDYSVLTN